jgi:hypothetical protein
VLCAVFLGAGTAHAHYLWGSCIASETGSGLSNG